MTVEGWIAEATESLKDRGTVNTIVALDINTAATKIRENVNQQDVDYRMRKYYKWEELKDKQEGETATIREQGWVFTFKKIEIHTEVDVEVEIHG